MKNILCISFFYICLFTSGIDSQWIQQVSGTPRDIIGIDMIDANTGYACGDGVGGILKTTNSGVNWIWYDEPTNDQYNGISFIDALTGIAVGPPGMVLRTSNGGINWSVINRSGGDMGPVHFVTPAIAYSAGDNIVKSTDGGLSWSVIRTGAILSQYQGLYFINENTGTVVGRPGLIITTTNGGVNWVQRTMYLPVQFGDSTLFDVKYVNALTGYACGNNGITMKTTNGGVNWIYYPVGSNIALFGLSFTNVSTGYAVGQIGRVMKTTNGGVNWILQITNTTSPLLYVDFVNQDTGWVVGFNGLIFKTTNGGVTWLEPISNQVPNKFSLEQNYPNPFNPKTIIRFKIKDSRLTTLKVFDILGREIAVLLNEELEPGVYEIEWDASAFPSGIYFYELRANTFRDVKKMTLIK